VSLFEHLPPASDMSHFVRFTGVVLIKTNR
jgi:hypothetical protein